MRLTCTRLASQDHAGSGINALLQMLGIAPKEVINAARVLIRNVVLECLANESARYRDCSEKFSI